MTFVDIGNAGNATDTTGDPNPAGAVGWNEAARFTNWLNTSTGGFAAYNFAGATGAALKDGSVSFRVARLSSSASVP